MHMVNGILEKNKFFKFSFGHVIFLLHRSFDYFLDFIFEMMPYFVTWSKYNDSFLFVYTDI
jgi:hypothetical protein